MTNERAIELLKRISDSQFDGIHGDERREALSMAVRALVEPNIGQKTIDCIIKRLNDEDNTVGDTIYRQDAIDAVDVKCLHRGIVKGIQGIIEDLPSAQPEGKKGVFIPDITVEMLRKASLEAVDDLLTSGEMKDIVLPSAQPEKTCCGYDEKELIVFAIACRRNEVDEKDLKTFAQDCEFAWRVMQEEFESKIREAFIREIDRR